MAAVHIDLSGAMLVLAAENAAQDEVQEFASQIDGWFMRWGLRHSFGEGYTVREAGQLVDGVPFAGVRIEPDGISMAIWLEK